MDPISSATVLLSSALVLGITHTLLGPDHYLPFVALGKARNWSLRRTLAITAICGIGHLATSVLIGVIGAFAGWSLSRLEWLEAARGEVAAWLLLAFGLAYLVWAGWNGFRGRAHTHPHAHADGTIHSHPHSHHAEHAHPHLESKQTRTVTAWSLFIIFVFGPCEVLIPLLLFPAMSENTVLAVAVVAVFALSTLATMTGMVWALARGVNLLRLGRFGRYGHFAAGLVLVGCGAAIHLGL